MTYQLFSKVMLTEDIPEYDLTRGQTGVVVEYYSMPGHQENGYSIEGLVDGDTVEVKESQIQRCTKIMHIKTSHNSQNSNLKEVRK